MSESSTNDNNESLRDRILFVYDKNFPNWNTFVESLQSQGYQLFVYNEEFLPSKINFVIDLIIFCLNSKNHEKLEELQQFYISPNTPAIIFKENNDIENGVSTFTNIQVLERETTISHFLVAVKIQLRLLKIRSEFLNNHGEVLTENALLRDLNNRFQKDLIEAREIHEKILPSNLPDFNKIRCASAYLPLELVGGDLFDLWKIDDDHLGVFLGDITGHGLPAAFIASMTKMCLALTPPQQNPAETFEFLNRNLSKYLPDGRFITALNCEIDVKNQTISYSNAGHPPPIFYCSLEKSIKLLTDRNLPLNVLANHVYTSSKVAMHKNDKLLIYSDGLFETVNMENQVLGIELLSKKFLEYAQVYDIDVCLEKLLSFMDTYSDGRKLRDDVTIIGVELL